MLRMFCHTSDKMHVICPSYRALGIFLTTTLAEGDVLLTCPCCLCQFDQAVARVFLWPGQDIRGRRVNDQEGYRQLKMEENAASKQFKM